MDESVLKALRKHICLFAFLAATAFVLWSYLPLLMPLLDKRLEFCYGDLSSFIGDGSAAVRAEHTFNVFDYGRPVPTANRAFLLESASIPMGWMGASDSQTTSLILLATIIIGCIGLEALIRHLAGPQGGLVGATIRLAIIPFYFLNLWSVERTIHLWIWYTYAILPLILFLGLSYLGKKGRAETLIAYSLIIAIYGMVPHSLMYAAFIHVFLAAYSCGMLFLSKGLVAKKAILFISLPCVIYALTNLPVLLLPAVSGLSYPYTMEMGMLSTLSNNGSLIQALTIANNWWPQIPYSLIAGNEIYRASSIAIISLIILLCAIMMRGMDERSRWLAPLSIASILCFLFIGQGFNNPFISAACQALESHGLLWTTSLFREWARICIMIPIFLVAAYLMVASAARGRARAILALAMLSLVLVNIASSPAGAVFQKFAPVQVPDDYYSLSRILPGSGKTLLIAPAEETTVNGNGAYAWNPDKSRSNTLEWFNDRYGSGLDEIISKEEAPQALLDDLGIRYVMKSREDVGAQGFPAGYDWLGCQEMPYFTICRNNGSVVRFRAYSGAILAEGEPKDHYGLYFLNLGGIAVSSEGGPWNRFALMNGSGSSPSDAGVPLFLLEAERGFRTSGQAVDLQTGRLASGGHVLVAKQDTNLSRIIVIPNEGDYMFAFRGQGNFTLSSGGSGYKISTVNMAYTHIPKNLKQGEQEIKISAKAGSFFDSLIIFPEDGNKTLDGMFGEDSAGAFVTSYERSSPTRWDARVDSSRPFLLSFAESFSPYWEARVYRGGTLVETAKSTKLFDSMNGFWIKSTGQGLDVKVVFAPQEAFESELAISALTIVVCALFLVKGILGNPGIEGKGDRRMAG